MALNTWFSILAFFVFVAPGVLYDLLSARKRVQRRESTFTEISRIALASTWCSLAALLFLISVGVVAGLWDKQPFPDPLALMDGGTKYLSQHLAAVTWAAFLGIFVSFIVAILSAVIIHRKKKSAISYVSSWLIVLRKDRPNESSTVHVRAKLKDGTTWFGKVAHYSPDHEVSDRDLVLCPPLATRSAAENSSIEEWPAKWTRVILPGSEIVSLAVSYGPADEPAGEPT